MQEKIGTEIDGYAVVAGHWPLVGPYSPSRTVYAAQALAALVSYLDHALAAPEALTAHDADGVAADVDRAVAGLPAVAEAAHRRRG